MLALGGHTETGRAIIGDYWQTCFLSKAGQLALPDINQGTDDLQVPGINGVGRFHGAQTAAMEYAHHK